jgi:hypothetical protein
MIFTGISIRTDTKLVKKEAGRIFKYKYPLTEIQDMWNVMVIHFKCV